MNADQALALRAGPPDAHQPSAERSKGLLRLKAGAPSGPVTSTDGKSVLLVDSNLRSRESRAKVMRDKGVRVDTVATADAARVRLAAETYNLVLLDFGRDIRTAESLAQDIRAKNSRQLVGFLVGRPLFVSKTLSGGTSHRQPGPVVVATSQKAVPVAEPITFGQRIRNAEAETAGS